MALAMVRAMAFHGGGVWSRLSDEALLLIVTKLPTITLVRMRAVCKGWNKLLSSTTALKIIYRNVPIVSTPAFFILLPWFRWGKNALDDMQSWVIDSATGDLLKVPSPKLDNDHMDLRRNENTVVCAYKSIYCLSQKGSGFGTAFSICNPSTNTCKCLPYLKRTDEWTFGGMAFDPYTRHFTLLVGGAEYNCEGIGRGIRIDIYDSEYNAWTVVAMHITRSTGFPSGMGIYSKGRFHWLDDFGSAGIIQFNMLEREWAKIPPPRWVYFSNLRDFQDFKKEHDFKFKTMNYSFETWDGQLAVRFDSQDGVIFRYCSWWLTGTDGRVILVNEDIRCMWELEEETNEWCQLHITLPNPFYGVSVNSSRWALVAGEKEMVIYDGGGRVVRTIEYSKLNPLMQKAYRFSQWMWAFEWNNIWWP